MEIADKAGALKEGASLNILSGATSGSSFARMARALKAESIQTSQQMQAAASKMQAQMKAGGWLAGAKGGFGIDASFANDMKSLLSMQQISSHASIISMGSIPSIKLNQVKIGAKEFSKLDPSDMMSQLATLANSTQKEHESLDASAAVARTGNQMVQLRGAEIQSVMTGLKNLDEGENKMLDINSLMTAFEDYVNKALGGNLGVPINYYVKPITKSLKHYPQYAPTTPAPSAET